MFVMEETKSKSKADIRIIGVGGGGSNAIETMIKEGIQGVQFIAVNTDDQALEGSSAEIKIQLGSKLTKGLGAGANPEIGRRAAVESYEEIVKALRGADMVFVTAGMGGGTGTGGAPLVAQAAEELDILTVGIVTNPFLFEGRKRMKQAEKGIRELRNYVDTLIVVPNEKLLQFSKKETPLVETFKITDNILLQAVKGIAELVSVPGLINLDFADIKTVMLDKGMALMGRGVSEGADRAKRAVCEAISSPLLDGVSIKGATGMIVNITAGSSLSLIEVQEASSILTKVADDEADIIVGTVIDKNMGDKLSVTVIATGFPSGESEKSDSTLLSLKKNLMSQVFNKEVAFAEDQKNLQADQKQEISIERPNLEEEKTVLDQIDDTDKESSNIKSESSFITKKPENPIFYQEEEKEFSEDPAFYQEEEKEKSAFDQRASKSKKMDQTPVDANKEEDSIEPPSNTDKEQLSSKEKLLSKVKEYAQKQTTKKEVPENQMNMEWIDNSLEENLSSPFESSIDFSNEDMI